MVPTDGYIRKFVVLDNGLKINTEKDVSLLEDIVVNIGLNVPIPLFTLVKIRYKEKPVDVGTYYFMFTEYDENGIKTTSMEYVFKSAQPNQTIFVRAKDILNIRSEFNTIKLSKNRFSLSIPNYDLDDFDTEFYMYHVTILIQLDPW